MSTKSFSLLLALQLPLAGLAAAASYSTSFDSISGGATLSDADGWETNDPWTGSFGQADYVGVIPGYSATVNDHWAALGGITGVAPGQPTIYLDRPVDLSGASGASFSVDMAVTSSASPRTNEDTFGWTFLTSSNAVLFSLQFDPSGAVDGDLNVRLYNSSNSELVVAGSGSWDIFHNSIYSLAVEVGSTGLVDVFMTDANNITTQVITGAATGIDPSDIGSAAATWKLVSPSAANTAQSNFGSNALVFDNYSLVPEPSTALLGLFGGLFAFRRRRNA